MLPDLPSSAADAAAMETAAKLAQSEAKPFQILLLRHEEQASGAFRPAASVALTPALRTSGLLLSLPAEELRSLLLLLTFVHPNGHIQPSALELGQALHLSQMQTRARMRRLERFRWQGKPLLHELRRDSGLHGWTPSRRLIGIQQEPAPLPQDSNTSPLFRAAGREAIVAHSRATYARPRDVVEEEIARRNGWPWPPLSLAEHREQQTTAARDEVSSPHSLNDTAMPNPERLSPPIPASNPDGAEELRQELRRWGVPADLALRLLHTYEPERIRRQLAWLPYRRADSPSRLLVAAIEHDYEAPRALPDSTADSPN